MNASETLAAAGHIIEGRRSKHGAENSFSLIAKLWSSYLQEAMSLPGNITPTDVAQLMVLLKVARSVCGDYNPDNFVDQAGYSAWAADLMQDEVKKSAVAEAVRAQAEQQSMQEPMAFDPSKPPPRDNVTTGLEFLTGIKFDKGPTSGRWD